MGGSNSKQTKTESEDFGTTIRSKIEDEIAKKMMIQREVQMAVNIAKARDTIWYFGSAWGILTTGFATAHALGRKPPPLLAAPIVIGALILGNIADMAYGTKLIRVVKEAEHILEHERGRLVPFKQAAFFKFYDEQEKAPYYHTVPPVGHVFPNPYLFQMQRRMPSSSSKE